MLLRKKCFCLLLIIFIYSVIFNFIIFSDQYFSNIVMGLSFTPTPIPTSTPYPTPECTCDGFFIASRGEITVSYPEKVFTFGVENSTSCDVRWDFSIPQNNDITLTHEM